MRQRETAALKRASTNRSGPFARELTNLYTKVSSSFCRSLPDDTFTPPLDDGAGDAGGGRPRGNRRGRGRGRGGRRELSHVHVRRPGRRPWRGAGRHGGCPPFYRSVCVSNAPALLGLFPSHGLAWPAHAACSRGLLTRQGKSSTTSSWTTSCARSWTRAWLTSRHFPSPPPPPSPTSLFP